MTTKDRKSQPTNRRLLTELLDCDLDVAGPLAAVDEVSCRRLLPLRHAADVFPGIFGTKVLQLEQVDIGTLLSHGHVTGCLTGNVLGAQGRHGVWAHHGHRWAAEDPRHREETLRDILGLDGAAKLQRLTGREGPPLRAHLDAEVPIWVRKKYRTEIRFKIKFSCNWCSWFKKKKKTSTWLEIIRKTLSFIYLKKHYHKSTTPAITRSSSTFKYCSSFFVFFLSIVSTTLFPLELRQRFTKWGTGAHRGAQSFCRESALIQITFSSMFVLISLIYLFIYLFKHIEKMHWFAFVLNIFQWDLQFCRKICV